MPTEAIQTDFSPFDSWSLEKRLSVMIEANMRAVAAVRGALSSLTQASDGIRSQLLKGGRLVYVGAGTSGRLALQDAAELEPTFGFERSLVLLAGSESREHVQTQEDAEDDEEAGLSAVKGADIGTRDVVIGITASGRTPYTLAALSEAKRRGAFTVGIANNPNTPLLQLVDAPVLIDTGPEVIAGSTRMAAGTAQKVALNILSTAPMPELGAIYKNLMVGMLPVNEKLFERAVHITVAATDVSEQAARAALLANDWDIRRAVVTLKTKLEPEAGALLLEQHGNQLQAALNSLEQP